MQTPKPTFSISLNSHLLTGTTPDHSALCGSHWEHSWEDHSRRRTEQPPCLGFKSIRTNSGSSWKGKWSLWAPSFLSFLVSFCEVFGSLWPFFMPFYIPSNWPWFWDFNFFLSFWCLELLVSTATHLVGNPVFAGLAIGLCGKKVHFHQQIKQRLLSQAAWTPHGCQPPGKAAEKQVTRLSLQHCS